MAEQVVLEGSMLVIKPSISNQKLGLRFSGNVGHADKSGAAPFLDHPPDVVGCEAGCGDLD
ncbi:MAG: hypothetical protein QXE23_04860, partial [Nitrososphaerota archaeon]